MRFVEGVDLEGALKRDVLRDVASAGDEVGKEGEDKRYIDDMVGRQTRKLKKTLTCWTLGGAMLQ